MTTMTIENAKTKVVFKKGDVLRTALTEEPGAGAVKFAKMILEEYNFLVSKENYRIKLTTGDYYEIADMFRANGGINNIGSRMEYNGIAIEVAGDIIYGDFEEFKRIKRCHFCGYFYWDITKNNSSHVCSSECKQGKDIVLKHYRRQIRNAGKQKRPTYKDLYYLDGEYPCWTNEYRMFEYDRKRGCYSYGDDLEVAIARHQLNVKMGGKKKKTQAINYNGTEKVTKIAVRLNNHSEKVKSKTTVIRKSREEIEKHLLETYGATKLAEERIRAEKAGRGFFYVETI
ncbi:hypothetical protein [Rummeliibacillus suwonensis]|uniref:hypothetical protein n=1 Tax=Rummeliibacillus suwonensis TaxID=1306154 RepID=UPI0011B50AA2|nr:hypothetical protein [Rummeliibacillus suwonensis]